MDTLYYTYVYMDPRKPGKYSFSGLNECFLFEPFYVGKGKNYRMNHHVNAVECGSKYIFNSYKNAKIKKIIHEGLRPIILIFEHNLPEKTAFEVEKKLIKEIGRKDNKTGPLCNFTDGGEGSSGRVVSEMTKQKIREKLIGKKASVKTVEKMKKNNSGVGNPNYGKLGNKNAWYGKKHKAESIAKMKHPKTKGELDKRKNTKRINSKNRINVSGKIELKNISIIEASEATGVKYQNIYYGLKRGKTYTHQGFCFSIISG